MRFFLFRLADGGGYGGGRGDLRLAGRAGKEAWRMAVLWEELTEAERTALKRMNRGPYPALSPDLAERLIARGLAVRRDSGVGISRQGRELVIAVLLHGRGDAG